MGRSRLRGLETPQFLPARCLELRRLRVLLEVESLKDQLMPSLHGKVRRKGRQCRVTERTLIHAVDVRVVGDLEIRTAAHEHRTRSAGTIEPTSRLALDTGREKVWRKEADFTAVDVEQSRYGATEARVAERAHPNTSAPSL